MADITLVIGNKAYSTWSLRPWLALKQTGALFDEVIVPLSRPDSAARLRAESPSARVPVLRHGDLVIWESLAILEYLAETWPQAGLWPADATARAVARAVSAEMHAGFAALRGGLPMDLKRRKAARALPPAVEADVARIQALWRDCRTRFGEGGPFLFGSFTAADAMFAPVATRFDTYKVPVDDTAAAYVEAILTWPALRLWQSAAEAEPWIIEAP
ncbi:MAG: glutathione S-transferase [Alphaproteobacteria bacterium]|jgi:glutathione S-transferase|nr:glutathione S-transferase [Alphaproteobacteria bacterium]